MRAGRPSRTAQHNALFRALDARRAAPDRIAGDTLAVRFLPPAFRLVAEAARFRAVRRFVETFIDRRWPGPRDGVVARTRLIDDEVRALLPDVAQVLLLGAGFDTRAYRLTGMEGVRVFEVDHPSTQVGKRRTVGRVDHVTFVPVQFGRDDLETALTSSGFLAAARTLVLWEGVTNYLTAASVDATFATLARLLADGSHVLFTYVDRGLLDGSRAFAGATESSRHVRRVGEPYTFGLDPCAVGAYLAERGFELVWDIAVPEAASRYGIELDGYAYYHVVRARTS